MLLVFASNWWFNDKKVKDVINEIDFKIKSSVSTIDKDLTDKINTFLNDKVSELNQLQSKLQEEVSTNLKELTLHINNSNDKIKDDIRNNEQNLSSVFNKQLDNLSDNFKQQLSNLNDSINTNNSNIKDLFESKIDNVKNQLNSDIQKTITELSTIRSSIYRNEYWMWEARGVPSNALRALLNELEIKIQQQYPLDFYLRQISEISSKLSFFSKGDKERARELLSKISGHDEVVENILKTINEVKET